MKVEKVLSILLWILLAVSAFLVVSLMSNIVDDKTDTTMGSWINLNLSWSYVLLALAAGVAVLGTLFHTLTSKEAAKKGLTSLGFAVVVVGVSYIMASDAIPSFYGVENYVNDGTLTNTIAKWIDTTLITTYVLLGLLVLATIVSSVSRIFK